MSVEKLRDLERKLYMKVMEHSINHFYSGAPVESLTESLDRLLEEKDGELGKLISEYQDERMKMEAQYLAQILKEQGLVVKPVDILTKPEDKSCGGKYV